MKRVNTGIDKSFKKWEERNAIRNFIFERVKKEIATFTK